MALPCRAHALTPALLLLSLVSPQAWAQDSEDVSKLLATIRTQPMDCHDYSEDLWKALNLKPLSQAVAEAAKARSPVASIQREYSLPESAARHLLAGRLAVCRSRNKEPGKPETQLAVDQYSLAARDAPGHLTVLGAFLSLPGSSQIPDFDTRVLQALDYSPDPAKTALELARAGEALYGWQALLVAFAVQRKPEKLVEAVELLGTSELSPEATLFYFEALQRALGQKPPPPFLQALADRTIRNLILHERPQLALETLRALPEALRNAVLADAGEAQSGENSSAEESALTLAAEFFLEGRRAEASKLFTSLQASTKQDANAKEPPRARECAPRLQREVLAFHLANERSADPFDVAVEIETCGFRTETPWPLLFASMLPARYTDTIRRQLTAAAESLEDEARQADTGEQLASLFPLALPRFHATRKAEAARLRAALASLPAPQPRAASVEEGGAVSKSIARVLESPRPPLFEEKQLPRGIKPSPVKQGSKPATKGLALPKGFWPVRVERQGARVLLIALAQALDPGGEVSGGAYWLCESKDGGKTWDAPLYLGLQEYRPYVVVPSSALPMLRGDLLQLEVQVRELDESSITFPPVNLRTKRSAEGLYLEAKLSALRADSDGDGLLDLVEARLLTDPNAPDTDGDGISDGEDPLPQVSAAATGLTPEADVLAAFLVDELDMPGPEALVVGLPDEGESELRLPKGSAPPGANPVTFLVANRAQFQGVRLRSRTIILTPDEYKKAEGLFGRFYPLEIEPPIFNEAHDKVFLRYSEHWRGGSFTGQKKDGRWQFTSISSWIT